MLFLVEAGPLPVIVDLQSLWRVHRDRDAA